MKNLLKLSQAFGFDKNTYASGVVELERDKWLRSFLIQNTNEQGLPVYSEEEYSLNNHKEQELKSGERFFLLSRVIGSSALEEEFFIRIDSSNQPVGKWNTCFTELNSPFSRLETGGKYIPIE